LAVLGTWKLEITRSAGSFVSADGVGSELAAGADVVSVATGGGLGVSVDVVDESVVDVAGAMLVSLVVVVSVALAAPQTINAKIKVVTMVIVCFFN
jgi:hypothetical protein